jgi:N12 class adenine-specific DNA methylase
MPRRQTRKEQSSQLVFDLWGLSESAADVAIDSAATAPLTPVEQSLVTGQLSFDLLAVEQEEEADEQVRSPRPGILDEGRSDAIRRDNRSGDILRGTGGANLGDSQQPVDAAGAEPPSERELSRDRGPAQLAAEASRGNRDGGPGLHPGRALDGGRGARAGGDAGPGGGEDPRTAGEPGGTYGGDFDGGVRGRERALASTEEPNLSFRPVSQEELAPSGPKARFDANVSAILLSRRLEEESRPATADEQQVLARWSSWGALPQVFDESKSDWSRERAQLQDLLSDEAYSEARRTTINAHYTDPAYVREIWSTLERLGFEGGDVLEPGSGAGTFIGMAPEGTSMTGIELDSTTAAISRGLYPGAEIRTESFADTRFPAGRFDATVGNVPFADVRLHDPVHNQGGHSMHNHFIIKSLAMTRPGGMVAVLTSSFTMDAANPAARREMNGMADLVGAVRLPSGAFRRSAGTEAVTDLLVFRRREAGVPAGDQVWETVSPRIVDGQKIKVNAYFDVNPEHLLGELRVGTGMYGDATVSVRADLDATPDQFRETLIAITDRAIERSQVFTTPTPAALQERSANVADQTDLWDGTIVANNDDSFTIVAGRRHTPLAVPKNATHEMKALLGLRDSARDLLEAEAATLEDTSDIRQLRTDLRNSYDSYAREFGPLNRFTLVPAGKEDPETGQRPMSRRVPRPMVILRQDPFGPLVMALERFDEQEQTAVHASIMSQRIVTPRLITQGADTPSEAIALSLDRTGGVDLDIIADLLGETPDEARASLGEMVYTDPGTGGLINAPEYLSGNVVEKLEVALAAVGEDETLQVNVNALRAIVPDPIGIEEIEARLGAVWIDTDTHQQFLAETLNDRTVRVENPIPGQWEVRGLRQGIKATNEWGTERRPAVDLAQSLMEQKPITVYDEYEDAGKTRRVLNPVETTAAQERAVALQERFSSWVWEDPARATRLGAEYNRRFNSIVLRDYSTAGDYLTLPGLAATFVPRPHQRAAVARMVAEPAVGLFHQVGAGKTAEMVIGAMELKRMGLVNKPVIVVPNHMLEQFSREWLQMYPQARLLAASSDNLVGDKRRLFVARAAANDWDAIVMTQGAFKKIPLSAEFEASYIAEQVADMRAVLDEATGDAAMSIKRIEKRMLSLQEKYKAKLDIPKDPGLSFEDSGIDYVIVDEAHMYKNLATESNIQDARIDGSQQSSDLHMKLEYLRGRHGDRVATLATATPLSNSVTEAYIMQRFLRPDLLEKAGVTSFDGWAATFGQQVTEMEMSPAGGFKLKTRFSKFQNVPEMLRMWHVFADVKTAEDLNLPVPLIARRASDGERQAENVLLPATPEVAAYIAAIVDRAEAVQNRSVDPSEDNMLKISTDGRKAALDIRLVDQFEMPTGLVKLDNVAANVFTHWSAAVDRVYTDDVTGVASPVEGGLQLVFCDLGTPNPNRWNAYDELKLKLVELGMPETQIRFIHEAKNDVEKARLFAGARSGHVSVLIGSTAKMGVGTNVQSRLLAMHHVDVPWRPSDVEQRDGRGIRQGNQNAEVGVYRYIVEGSFDAFSWQTVARKATFINQIMRGRLDTREIEDIGDTALSAAEAKALASGNPLILEKANADNELQKLRRQEIAHHRAQTSLGHARGIASSTIDRNHTSLSILETAVTRTEDISGENFRMVVGDREYDSRADAGQAIAQLARDNGVQYASSYNARVIPLGTIAGHHLEVQPVPALTYNANARMDIMVSLSGIPNSESRISMPEFLEAGVGVVRSLENKTTALPRTIVRLNAEITEAQNTITQADARLGQPFKYADDLAAAYARVEVIYGKLAELASGHTAAHTVPADAAPLDPELQKLVDLNNRNFPTTAGHRAGERPSTGRGYQPPKHERDENRGYER